METRHKIAKALLDIQAIQMTTDHYVTWTSGIRSPIYCDNRLTMSYPAVRKQITEAFTAIAEEVHPDVIAGCATAGIPHAAWLADALNLPMIYVRSKPKKHGLENQIEGQLDEGARVLVIEDLVSTGSSSIEASAVLRDAGACVVGVAAIFTYGLNRAEKQFNDASLALETITDFQALVDVLKDHNQLTKGEEKELLDWRAGL